MGKKVQDAVEGKFQSRLVFCHGTLDVKSSHRIANLLCRRMTCIQPATWEQDIRRI